MKNLKLAVGAAVLAGGALVAGPLTSASGAPGTPDGRHSQTSTDSIVFGSSVSVPPGQIRLASATCPAGTIVSGGGADTPNTGGIVVTSSHAFGNGWHAHATNLSATAGNVTASVVCLGLA